MTFQFCDQRCLSCETDGVHICGQDANGNTRSIRTDSSGRLDITVADLDIRNLNCNQDSVSICGQGVEGANHLMQTDTYGNSSSIPSASAYSQLGRLFSFRQIHFLSRTTNLFQLVFRNPETNNRTMYLDKLISGIAMTPQEQIPMHYECQLLIRIHGDLELNDLGIAAPGIPMNVGFFNTASSVAIRIFVSAGLDQAREIFSVRQLNEMITVDFQGRIVLPPGHDLFFTFEANRIETANISLEHAYTITFYEL